MEGYEYEFSVSANNAAGVGERICTGSCVTVEDPVYPPEAPNNIQGIVNKSKTYKTLHYFLVLDTTKSSIAITWLPPLYDGGSAIIGYNVEICKHKSRTMSSSTIHSIESMQEEIDIPDEDWLNVSGKKPLSGNVINIAGLTEGFFYNIRVAAVNKTSVGEYLLIR